MTMERGSKNDHFDLPYIHLTPAIVLHCLKRREGKGEEGTRREEMGREGKGKGMGDSLI